MAFNDDIYQVTISAAATDSAEFILQAKTAFDAVQQAEKRLRRTQQQALINNADVIQARLLVRLTQVQDKEP